MPRTIIRFKRFSGQKYFFGAILSVAPFSPPDFAERDFVYEWVLDGVSYTKQSKNCVEQVPAGVEMVWVHYKDWEQGRLYRVLNGYVHLHLLEMG